MANSFTDSNDPGSERVRMSNGTTAVVFDLLAIAGTTRARTDWEKKLVWWLVAHDQERIGLGMAGFDLSEMGWTAEGFATEKRFVLDVLDDAIRGTGWERLSFVPGDGVVPVLEDLRRLLERYRPSAFPTPSEWELPVYGTCEVHAVYLHERGCIVCNDAPCDAPPEERPHSVAHPG